MSRVRRAPIVVAATAAGLVGLLTFRSHPASESLALTSSGTSSSGSTSSRTTATNGSTNTTTTTASGSTSTSTTTSSSASTATTTNKRTAIGESVNYNYGTLSVKVSASGTKITSVTLASFEDDGSFRSESIDEQAIPTLEEEALDAQSADIQSVSGASYTSEGFITSLQSALSKLGIS